MIFDGSSGQLRSAKDKDSEFIMSTYKWGCTVLHKHSTAPSRLSLRQLIYFSTIIGTVIFPRVNIGIHAAFTVHRYRTLRRLASCGSGNGCRAFTYGRHYTTGYRSD